MQAENSVMNPENPSTALLDAIYDRLPWAAIAPYYICGKAAGINVRTDDRADETALLGLGEHLIGLANGSDSEAQVLLALMTDESLQFFAAMVGSSVIHHCRTHGAEWHLSKKLLNA
jgi:hypothetical protein